jgi:hypothetical protein
MVLLAMIHHTCMFIQETAMLEWQFQVDPRGGVHWIAAICAGVRFTVAAVGEQHGAHDICLLPENPV